MGVQARSFVGRQMVRLFQRYVRAQGEALFLSYKTRLKTGLLGKTLRTALEDIILQYTYPRLDAEVSKHRNHLLKAPFCVHPATGRVCVPLDLEMIENFDPKAVPTVFQLLAELDAIQKTEDQDMELHSGMVFCNAV